MPELGHKFPNGDSITFVIDGVYSESYDPEVPSIPTLHQFREFCHLVHRTLPPDGVLEFAFPTDDRCFNLTIYDLERHTGREVWRKKHVWNQNSGLTRRYVNTSDSCVTIKIHNDDDHRVLDIPIFWNLGLTMVTGASGDSTSPSNVNDYGGFSLGGTDSSSSEFGSPPGPGVTVDASPGCSLSDVPGRLGAGVGQLTLTHPIPVWHPTWARVALRLSVAGVTSPGELLVTCPTSGFSGAQAIGARGQYVVDLGVVPNSAQFEITLMTQSGLDFDVDAIGIVPITETGAGVGGVEAAPPLAMTHLGANPIRGHGQVRLDLPSRQQVDLAVFDLMGRKVASLASGVMKAGSHVISWSGRDDDGAPVPNGLYFCRLRAASGTRAIRWVMLR